MDLNDLKSTWYTVQAPVISTDEIQVMLSEKKHPVLKSIRLQFIIEIIVWCIFLLCYYSMFDGDRKSVWINMILILSITLPVIHNIMGYSLTKYVIQGANIQESLKKYISQVKVYGAVSIASRQVYVMGLLLFFSYGLSFNTSKYISLGLILVAFLIQFVISCRLWTKRLNRLEYSLNSIK